MKRVYRYLVGILLALVAVPTAEALAIDKKFAATNTFFFSVFDTSRQFNSVTGLTFADMAIHILCNTTDTTINETGDTLTSLGRGRYRLVTNDAIGGVANETECAIYVVGEGAYANNLASIDTAFIKVVGAVMSDFVYKTITISGAGNTVSVVESADLTESDLRAHVGATLNCPGATNVANRSTHLKVKQFTPATDRLTLAGSLPAALTAGDTCNLLVSTIQQ